MQGPGYQAALDQTRKAVEDDLMGKDPTKGAFFYNMRTPDQVQGDPPFQRETQHSRSGPYDSATKYKYIDTYGDPEVKPEKEKGKRPVRVPKRPVPGAKR